MGPTRHGATRTLGFGLGVLVATATFVAARPAQAGATILFPSVSVGTVTFYDGSRALGSVPVVKGKARLILALAKGTHPLRAVYNRSGAVLAAQSPVVTVTAT